MVDTNVSPVGQVRSEMLRDTILGDIFFSIFVSEYLPLSYDSFVKVSGEVFEGLFSSTYMGRVRNPISVVQLFVKIQIQLFQLIKELSSK